MLANSTSGVTAPASTSSAAAASETNVSSRSVIVHPTNRQAERGERKPRGSLEVGWAEPRCRRHANRDDRRRERAGYPKTGSRRLAVPGGPYGDGNLMLERRGHDPNVPLFDEPSVRSR